MNNKVFILILLSEFLFLSVNEIVGQTLQEICQLFKRVTQGSMVRHSHPSGHSDPSGQNQSCNFSKKKMKLLHELIQTFKGNSFSLIFAFEIKP